MDKAKAAVNDFMSKSGKHDTTVHETVAPAVKEEVVKPHHHEEVITAVDKEVHQDHYHRTVQPIKDREVLPEKHEAKLGAVQHREVDHRDQEALKKNLASEQAQFKNKTTVEATSHSQSAAPTIGGEHIHHHIHETIQPVIHKETIEPHITHTTVPIHEVHHNAAQHHSATQLPTMTMDEFKNKGGSFAGREERYDGFEGQPKNIGGSIKGMLSEDKTSTKHDASLKKSAQHGDFETGGAVSSGGAVGGATIGKTGRGIDGVGGADRSHTIGQKDALGSHGKGGAVGSTALDKDTEHHYDDKKSEPGLLKKLNPFSDADGDGKKGIMN